MKQVAVTGDGLWLVLPECEHEFVEGSSELVESLTHCRKCDCPGEELQDEGVFA